MKICFVDQMSKIRTYTFNISAKKAVYGISAPKIEYLS